MKKTIILIFLLGIGIMAYSNDIRNISIQCIDRNGYTSSNLESTQINNLLIEFDYYNDNQYVSEDDIKISIASIGIGYDYFLEVTNIKYGSNHCSAKIKSLSSNIASNFPAGQYALTITSGMAGSKFRSFTISEMKSVANTNTYTNTNNSTSSSSYSRSNAEASVGAVIAIAGAGYLLAKLFSMSDNKSSSSSSSSYSNSSYSSRSNYSGSNSSHNSSNSSNNSGPKITRDNILDYVASFEIDKSYSNEYYLAYNVKFKNGNWTRDGVFRVYYQIKDYSCFGCSTHSKGEWGILTGLGFKQHSVNPNTKQEALYQSCPYDLRK